MQPSASSDPGIWEYVHCSVCMVLFLPPNRPDPAPDIPFWLTECGHIVCNNHLKADQSCASCGATNVDIVPLQRNMSAPLSEWFRPLSESYDTLTMASRVQQNMFTALIRHYRQKYETAKVMIHKLQAEISALRVQQEAPPIYRPASRLSTSHFPLDQMPIHDSGYSSGHSSTSKRRRVDMETDGYAMGQAGGSSPRSIITPVGQVRYTIASGEDSMRNARLSNSAPNDNAQYQGHSGRHQLSSAQQRPGEQHQSGVRKLNPQQYAYLPPSTPLNNNAQALAPTAMRHQVRQGGVSLAQHQAAPRSAAMMPPPPNPQRFGSSSTARGANPAFDPSNAGSTVGGQQRRPGRYMLAQNNIVLKHNR
ncbi:hypothetical protein BDV93DRAFT_463498 [Ceratobasidium sp. AG-I]|nr:hypothetical protein BDV93DRAFT_463498 [Ceratobasidium sp. AG-I]